MFGCAAVDNVPDNKVPDKLFTTKFPLSVDVVSEIINTFAVPLTPIVTSLFAPTITLLLPFVN